MLLLAPIPLLTLLAAAVGVDSAGFVAGELGGLWLNPLMVLGVKKLVRDACFFSFSGAFDGPAMVGMKRESKS